MIELEDTYLDIIKKASIGKGFGKKELAKLCDEEIVLVNAFFEGQKNDSLLKKLSAILELDFKALINHANARVRPPNIKLEGLAHFQSQFPISYKEFMWVNHYIVYDSYTKYAVLIDTGTQSKKSIDWIKAEGLELKAIFITHQHKDHVYCLEDFTHLVPNIPIYNMGLNHTKENFQDITPVKNYTFGVLSIQAFETKGHTPDGLSYLVHGLDQPIVFVGDAIFAHSQGGIALPDDYASALKMNNSKILSLEPNTIIAPGHGPLTTVAHEQKNNPFYSSLYMTS